MTVELETGALYREDNLPQLSDTEVFPDESVDLIYLDPPFFSNRFYEVIWGDEAEVRSFEDRWAGGLTNYIDWMRQRVEQLHRVLRQTGSLYLHCDPHASHYLKVMLDSIFGFANFRNEIIWRRSGSHNSARRNAPIHDVILFYSKSDRYTWQPVHRPYMRGHVEAYFKKKDERGRYWTNALTGAGERKGMSGEPWRRYDPTAVGRHWAIPSKIVAEAGIDSDLSIHEKLDALDAAGFIGHPARGSKAMPTYRQYLDSSPGMPPGDIWAYQPYTQGTLYDNPNSIDADVRWLSPQDAERLGYPTQKPEGLLERIIRQSSRPGQVVLDPFCGCGTTVAVAERLRREWVGVDISPTAIEVMRRRLLRQGCRPNIYKVPDSADDLRALPPFEFQNWIINALNGKHSPRRVHDMGIDGYWFFTGDPIQVKQSSSPVGRNVVDNFETAMRRGGFDTGYIVGFKFTRDAHDEVVRAKSDGLNIRLITVAEILLLTKRPHLGAKLGPQPDADVLPLVPMRKPKDLPTAAELVASVRKRRAAGTA